MVSTRGVKFKFEEGEKLLCYEPDPSKARVLYDAKVLELSVSRDNRGKKIPEYLIHFSGWNSSWDRFVNETCILKDNEENRMLQKRLAEEAADKLKNTKKRRRFEEILKMSTDRSRRGEEELNNVATSSEESNSNSGSASSKSSTDEIEGDAECNENDSREDLVVHMLRLPDPLRRCLEDDYHLINKKNHIIRLPCEPNVVSILESYVRHFAMTHVIHHNEKRNHNSLHAERNLNLCREMAEGLWTYFNFTLPQILLYNPERKHYDAFMNNCKPDITINVESPFPTAPSIKITPPLPSPTNESSLYQLSSQSLPPKKEKIDEASNETTSPATARRTLRSYSGRSGNPASPMPMLSNDAPASGINCHAGHEEIKISRITSEDGKMTPEKSMRQTSRSNANQTSVPPRNGTANSCNNSLLLTSLEPNKVDSQITSSISSRLSVSSSGLSSRSVIDGIQQHKNQQSTLMKDILAWRLPVVPSPPEGLSAWPSSIFGAHHLLRLFVRLPELLTSTTMPPYKMKVLVKHLQMFIHYLEDRREELFSGIVYREHLVNSAEQNEAATVR